MLITNDTNVLINNPVEICVNPMGAGRANVKVTAKSPTNVNHIIDVEERDFKYFANIIPNEIGQFTCYFF